MSVQMRHDGIDQEIEVPEISVRHYERSGWKRVGGDQAVPVEETAVVTDPAVPVEEKAAAEGRRRTKGEN